MKIAVTRLVVIYLYWCLLHYLMYMCVCFHCCSMYVIDTVKQVASLQWLQLYTYRNCYEQKDNQTKIMTLVFFVLCVC